MALFSIKKSGAPPAGAPPQKGGKPSGLAGLFGGKPKEVEAGPSLDVLSELNTLIRRMKLLEEQVTTLRRKQQMLEQNMLHGTKKMINEGKLLGSDMTEIRDTLRKIEDKVILVIKELKLSAKKDELDLLKRYVNLWEPVNFVTKNEVRSIVEDVLSGKTGGS